MADRYTYFSYIGLFIALTFGALDLAARLRIPAQVLAAIAGIAVAFYAAVAMRQVRFWKDSQTLFRHTLAVTRDNSMAEYLVGQTLQVSNPDEAIVHLRRAILLTEPLRKIPGSMMPVWYPEAHVGLGMAELIKANKMPASPTRTALISDGLLQNRRALVIDPDSQHAKNNIGLALQMMPRNPLQADYDEYLNEGTAYSQAERFDEAVIEFRHAVEIAPQSVEAHIYLGLGLLQANKKAEGIAEIRAAKALNATQANQFLTKALHLPANEGNLDGFLEQATR
jgi:tetratricopeptide (TPR) repeat protein